MNGHHSNIARDLLVHRGIRWISQWLNTKPTFRYIAYRLQGRYGQKTEKRATQLCDRIELCSLMGIWQKDYVHVGQKEQSREAK